MARDSIKLSFETEGFEASLEITCEATAEEVSSIVETWLGLVAKGLPAAKKLQEKKGEGQES